LKPNPPLPSSAPTPKKQRLDLLLVERGLAENQDQARRLIMAGEVMVNNTVRDKAGERLPIDAELRLRNSLPYVSRGGLKLAAALDEFQIDVAGLIAVDVGASTGGFTDCLLQRGVARVYAIDVGYGELAWKLRTDARVVAIERTNIRHLTHLPDNTLADLAVIDASFISLALVLPATLRLLTAQAHLIALIKPQFEAAKDDVGKGGVVRDQLIHRRVLEDVVVMANQLALSVAGLTVSPAPGPAGNIEFLVWLRRSTASDIDPMMNQNEIQPDRADSERMIDLALQRAIKLSRSER
jgi:23S rRNA (cytidine1920-2'-O)/16S rRNA (cytidine1409-2'-O)-methyltransferase